MLLSLTSLRSRFAGRTPGDLGRLIALNLRYYAGRLGRKAREARAADRAFDRRWGTDTAGTISVHDLGFARGRVAQCNRYEASRDEMLTGPLRTLGIDPTQHDFVDYGAGKGRMLMLAMQLGFRSVTGIELSHRLCDVARSNIANFARQNVGLRPAEVIGADATAWRPHGTRLIIYMFNPFGASILSTVLTRLEAAMHDGATESVRIIYANPEFADVIETRDGWKLETLGPGLVTAYADATSVAPWSAEHDGLEIEEFVEPVRAQFASVP